MIIDMKKSFIYGALAMAVAVVSGCKDDFEKYDNSWLLDNDEAMTLVSSSSSVKLDANALDDEVLTFTWTPARQMPEEYVLTYVTMLDLKTNEFGSSTVIRTIEDDGVFEKAYTNEELQNIVVTTYGKSISEITTLSFKVIAKWEGGNQFVMPEVRTVDVDVQPFRPLVFEADKVFLDGEAVKTVAPTMRYTVTRTPENEFIHANEFLMAPGRMTIPISYDGVTRYICPASGLDVNVPDSDQVGDMPAGTEEYPATVMDIPEGGDESDLPAWNLTSDAQGFWRVIIDMEHKTVKFFSPKNRLEPASVTFWYQNKEDWELKRDLNAGTYYLRTTIGGSFDNWAGKPFDFVQSQIDPQLLICQGLSLSYQWKEVCVKLGGKIADFEMVTANGTPCEEGKPNYPIGNSTGDFVSRVYAFCPDVKDDNGNYTNGEMVKSVWLPMVGAVSNKGWTSSEKMTITKITIDIRNMRIRFD